MDQPSTNRRAKYLVIMTIVGSIATAVLIAAATVDLLHSSTHAQLVARIVASAALVTCVACVIADYLTDSKSPSDTWRVTVDVAVFTYFADGSLRVLVIKRRYPPHQGKYALPGGHIDPGEYPVGAAGRELDEEARLKPDELFDVGFYGAPGRDPRGNYLSCLYAAYVPLDVALTAKAGSDAAEIAWLPAEPIISGEHHLAFDHSEMVRDGHTSLAELGVLDSKVL